MIEATAAVATRAQEQCACGGNGGGGSRHCHCCWGGNESGLEKGSPRDGGGGMKKIKKRKGLPPPNYRY